MNRCMLHQKAYCAICTTRPNIPEAPRSPAQPDALELLRELVDTIEASYCEENRARFHTAMDAARAFLAKASHG